MEIAVETQPCVIPGSSKATLVPKIMYESVLFASSVRANKDFIRSSLLSPDGNILLYWTELGTLSVDTITDSSVDSGSIDGSSGISKQLQPYSNFLVGESIYDVAWYPFMSAHDVNSCCFVVCSRDHPVHLYDVCGNLRASYVGRTHMDELAHTYSVCFGTSGLTLFAGSNRVLRCFDISTGACNSFNTDKRGQSGLLSCLSTNPDRSGCIAAGSYGQSVGESVFDML